MQEGNRIKLLSASSGSMLTITSSAGHGKSAGPAASSIAVAKVPCAEGVLSKASSSGSKPEAEATARLRERCYAMLQIHMRRSTPREADFGSDAATTKQWAMHCSRKEELHGAVHDVLEALVERGSKVSTIYHDHLNDGSPLYHCFTLCCHFAVPLCMKCLRTHLNLVSFHI